MKQFPRARIIYNKFVELAILSEFQENIFRTRILNEWSIKKQAKEFNVSEATVNRTIRQLKDMYDEIQKLHPNELPVRKKSKREEYLDNN